MRFRWLVVACVALFAAGCSCEDPNKKGIERVGHDEEILKGVNGAVNEVIRNSADCDVARPLILEAGRKIDEARPQLSAPAAAQTLDALQVQLERMKQVCP